MSEMGHLWDEAQKRRFVASPLRLPGISSTRRLAPPPRWKLCLVETWAAWTF